MATNQPPPKKGSADGGNFLTKKAGPLPVWGYIVVAVAAYLIYKKLSGSGTSSAGTAATTGTAAPATETITTPGGTYTGPSQGGIPESITNPTPTPGSTGAPTPGSGGNSTPPSSSTGPASTYVAVPTATAAQQDLNTGIPIYYEGPGQGAPAAGSSPGQITQTTPGGEWSVGGQPLPPGAGGTIYTKAAA
jgi:hypothetical protein